MQEITTRSWILKQDLVESDEIRALVADLQ